MNKEELLKLAEEGDLQAQTKVVDSYLFGLNGFEKSGDKLIECAEKDWGLAQFHLARYYSEGYYGVRRFFRDFLPSGVDVINDIHPSPVKLLECAEKDWRLARNTVCTGYANGKYGFEQSHDKLFELAERGWTEAQVYIIRGYEHGMFGFEENIEKAEELEKKWDYRFS